MPGAHLVTDRLVDLLGAPAESFEEIAPPPAPDYALSVNWAALPDRQDYADVTPVGEVDRQADALADVFFLHPTTYLSRKSWNQPLDDAKANESTDRGVLRNQASVFNGTARVYAPRYRQATGFSFADMENNGHKALELAYGDVKKAFEYYLANYNAGRPIILAAHSQGSEHGKRLLEDFFAEEPLKSKLVAAYLIGLFEPRDVAESDIGGIPVCDSPDQTGCWMTWSAMGPKVKIDETERLVVCVNPLTWRTDDELAPHTLNFGGVEFPADGNEPPEADVGVVSARCEDGILRISRPTVEGYSWMPFGRDNYHVYE